MTSALLRTPGRALACMLLAAFVWAGCAGSERTTRTAPPDTAAVAAVPVPVTVPERLPTPASAGAADTVRAGRFDGGKMWTFEYPPADYFEEAYGFRADEAWFERARLGALRIPGCTASFVSPNGLMLTNHHCSRGHLTDVSRPGENLLEDGFYAPTLAEERRAERMYAEQLIAIEDVTDEVYAALEGQETDAERAAARTAAIERITERVRQAAGGEGINVQVVSLYHGGRFSAYTFRRYEDVRLVMIPELQLGYYGGDPDNFTYPRYNLDMTLWRAYGSDGQPLQTEHYFRWSTEGAQEGDAVFVVGNPGSTSRLQTVAQLEYRRDLSDRALLDLLNARIEVMQAYVDQHENELALRNQLFSLLNAQKFYTGSLNALRDPAIIARRADAERNFLQALRDDPALQRQYGDLIDRVAAVQAEKRTLAADYEAFLGLTPTSGLGAAVLRRALLAQQYLSRREAGASEADLQPLVRQIENVADQPREVQEAFVAERFEIFQRVYGADSPEVRSILQGRTPAAAARALLDGSALATAEATGAALGAGTLAPTDPALQVVEALWPRYQAYQSAFAGLSAREAELASQVGRAKFEVYGTAQPPDATFSLRIADGVVAGYPYNGTLAPSHTTYYGLYDRYHSFGPGTDWDLPARWLNPPAGFDLETPLNLVSTNDIIGGNSGSPLLNRDLEVVGLVFDGNIESLSGAFIYLTDTERTVSVDARGMIEALDEIYDADRVVQELQSGRLIPSEADADEQMQGGR